MKHLLRFIGLAVALWFPWPTLAASIDTSWGNGICGVLVRCASGPGGVLGVDAYLTYTVVPIMQVVFVAVLVGYLFYYNSNLIFNSGKESTIDETKLAYNYAVAGAVIVAFSTWIVRAFSPQNSVIVNNDPLFKGVAILYTFVRVILGTALTVNIILQAFRLITSQGTDALVQRARQRFLRGMLGVAIVLLANVIVDGVFPEAVGGGGGNLLNIVDEIGGVANFLLTLLGAAAAIAVMVAGFLLVISIDETQKDRAKKIVRTSVISLAVVLASLAIVNEFIMLKP